ncbi:hypothetical protein OQA88_6264 [Cercophora sp. LCS_1]
MATRSTLARQQQQQHHHDSPETAPSSTTTAPAASIPPVPALTSTSSPSSDAVISRATLPRISPVRGGPMTRKRVASISTEDVGHPSIGDLSLNTPTTAYPGSARPGNDPISSLICLCTPAPKVPRPRNAFILYRQHHQAQVVHDNPGLANPDISKIIGEQWQAEPEDRKKLWKQLAEEEKQRHQLQYPDYRYQPRRGNKGVPPRLATAGGEEPGPCPKCGGRTLATPRTPMTPFAPSPPSSARPWPSMSTPYTPRGPELPDQQRFSQPSQSGMRGELSSRGGRPQWNGHPQGHGTLHDIQEDYDTMSPSEPKRRRFNDGPGPYPPYQTLPSSPAPYGNNHARAQHPRHSSIGSSSSAPSPTPGYGPQSSGPLPGPSMLARNSPAPGLGIMQPQGPMGPPPRPGSLSAAPGSYPHQQPRADLEDLRLPPLQTAHLPTSPSSESSMAPYSTATVHPSSSHYTSPHDTRARSVESMVMNIQYISKLRVLERISPPLPTPGHGAWNEAPAPPRGPIIAIESSDPRLLRLIAPVIEQALLASGECDVRSWYPADENQNQNQNRPHGHEEDVQMRDHSQPPPPTANAFSACLQTIIEWHAKSADMIKFVTTPHSSARGSDASASSSSHNTTITASEASGSGSGGQHQHQQPGGDSVKAQSSSSSPMSSGRRMGKLPVALLPAGFSLTTADRFACIVPIMDAYAPLDHWQWMATLWRGIAGADLVVYVHAVSDEELGTVQGVEVKATGLITVRVGVGEMEGGLKETTERRLGFEVVEWVRGGVFWHYWGRG